MAIKILMVCLGNICRSPLAEAILASKLPKDKFTVHSAGTANYHVGKQPDERSILTASNNGLDITSQKARQFTQNDLDLFEYIFVMDQSNYNNVIKFAQNDLHKSKVNLILNSLFPSKTMDVPDPYYEEQNGFDNVYKMLDEACSLLAKKLIKKHFS